MSDVVIQWMGGRGQALAISTASGTNSSALPASASIVRLVSSVDCLIEFGPDFSASNSTGGYLVAFTPEYIRIGGNPADGSANASGIKITALASSAAGTLWIKPCVD